MPPVDVWVALLTVLGTGWLFTLALRKRHKRYDEWEQLRTRASTLGIAPLPGETSEGLRARLPRGGASAADTSSQGEKHIENP